MFRHKGNARTFRHNFRLAAFLSYAAGLVNTCGVLALGVLSTNVTGHFAYFAADVLKKADLLGAYFLLYIMAFLTGAFISNFITEYFSFKDKKAPHNVSVFIEIALLSVIGFWGERFIAVGMDKRLLASFLLFAMGLQNSLVSKISNSAVRTTHLTGLFTDLGIELSQLYFYREASQRKKLLHSIWLRIGIIAFFFLGCVSGGYLYIFIGLNALVFASMVLVFALFYDNIRLGFYKLRKNFKVDGEKWVF